MKIGSRVLVRGHDLDVYLLKYVSEGGMCALESEEPVYLTDIGWTNNCIGAPVRSLTPLKVS